MSTEKWRQFFELMEEVVNLDGTAADRGTMILLQASDLGFENTLQEFVQECQDADDDFDQ